MAFESSVMPPEDQRTEIISLYKGKGEKTDGITLEALVYQAWLEKYMQGYQQTRICRVTEDLIEDEQWGFRSGRECIE